MSKFKIPSDSEESPFVPLIDPNFVEEESFGFKDADLYAHHLCEAADAYDMSEEIITSLVQWIGETYGEEAVGKALFFVSCEWDI